MSDICPICYCDFYDDDRTQLDCNHTFCDECLCRYIKDKIDERETNIYCPIDSCYEEIGLTTIGNVVDDEDLVDRYKKHKIFSGRFSI